MKVMKLALLGTAALAAVSVSARADDVSALKAQIEALNARMAAYEATPAVPAGYSLLSTSKGEAMWVYGVDDASEKGLSAHRISVLPTADVPATTTVEWNGYVRGAVIWHNENGSAYDAVDVRTKAGLSVKGVTDTAVGEVGAKIKFKINDGWNSAHGFWDGSWNGSSSATALTDGVAGWWKITNEMTLSAVQGGSLAGNDHGWDGAGTAYFIGDANGGYAWDSSQLRLAYSSGPVGFAIGVEDADNSSTASALGVAGEVTYAGDMFNAELNAGWQGDAHTGFDDAWTVNAGIGLNLSDMFSLSAAAGTGHTHTGADWDQASLLAVGHLTDAARIELAASKRWNDGAPDVMSYGGGIYYNPVSQLTIGVEAAVKSTSGAGGDATDVGLVTAFSF